VCIKSDNLSQTPSKTKTPREMKTPKRFEHVILKEDSIESSPINQTTPKEAELVITPAVRRSSRKSIQRVQSPTKSALKKKTPKPSATVTPMRRAVAKKSLHETLKKESQSQSLPCSPAKSIINQSPINPLASPKSNIWELI
jgi:hypothetical protein